MMSLSRKYKGGDPAAVPTKRKKITSLDTQVRTQKNRYCAAKRDNTNEFEELGRETKLFGSSSSTSQPIEAWPLVTDSTFNRSITDKLSGVTGTCSYVMKNGTSKTHSCTGLPKTLNWSDLSPYQSVVSSYIHPSTTYRGVLAFHGLGSGKTLVGIATMTNFFQKEPTRTCIFLGKPSLEANFNKDVDKVGDEMMFGKPMVPEERQRILRKKLIYISYEEMANRLCGRTQWNFPANPTPSTMTGKSREPGSGFNTLMAGTVQADSAADPLLNNTFIVIDEAHNLVKQLSKPKYPPEDAARVLLSAIRNATNCRLLFLTATPIQQESYEIGILLNLLIPKESPRRFPEVFVESSYNGHRFSTIDEAKTKVEFEKLFVSKDAYGIPIMTNQELFLETVRGVVSYYPVDFNYTQFAQIEYEPVTYVPMSASQAAKFYEKRKDEIEKDGAKITCLADNLEEDDDAGETGASQEKKTPTKACSTSLKVSNFVGNYRSDIQTAFAQKKLVEITPKCVKIAEIMTQNYDQKMGKQMVFTATGDVSIFALQKCLESMDWFFYDIDSLLSALKDRESAKNPLWCKGCDVFTLLKSTMQKKKAFVILNGEVSDVYKVKVITQFFNNANNFEGEYIHAIILNAKYSEGLSLQHTRNVHLMEPPRSLALKSQIIARAVRLCSHFGLEYPSQWKVRVFSYMMTNPAFLTVAEFSKNQGSSRRAAFPISKSNLTSSAPFDSTFVMGGDPNGVAVAATGPGTRKLKMTDIEYMNSKCAVYNSNPDSCEATEHCSTEESTGLCRLLGTESAVAKAALRKAQQLDGFLRLLRIGAIDCAVFQSMHDPNDPVKCHAIGEKEGTVLDKKAVVTYDLSNLAAVSKTSGSKESHVCSSFVDKDTCLADEQCNFDENSCKPKCDSIRDETVCQSEPTCIYALTTNFLTTSKTCQKRYPPELINAPESAIAISLASRDQYVLNKNVAVYNLGQRQGMVSQERIKGMEDTAKEKVLDKMTHIDVLRFMKKLLETEAWIPELQPTVDDFLERIKTLKVSEWKSISLAKTVMKLMLLRGSKQDAESTFFSSSIDLKPLMDLHVHKMQFVLKLTIGDNEYFISSKEWPGISVDINQLKASHVIVKEFQFYDLFLYMAFFYNSGETSCTMQITACRRPDFREMYGSTDEVITVQKTSKGVMHVNESIHTRGTASGGGITKSRKRGI